MHNHIMQCLVSNCIQYYSQVYIGKTQLLFLLKIQYSKKKIDVHFSIYNQYVLFILSINNKICIYILDIFNGNTEPFFSLCISSQSKNIKTIFFSYQTLSQHRFDIWHTIITQKNFLILDQILLCTYFFLKFFSTTSSTTYNNDT